MGIGMACGTRFYLLAIAATIAICLVVVLMQRFNWFHLAIQRQVVKVRVPADDGVDYLQQIADVLIARTTEFELVSMESIRGGALTELLYAAKLKRGVSPANLIAELRTRNSGQRVASTKPWRQHWSGSAESRPSDGATQR